MNSVIYVAVFVVSQILFVTGKGDSYTADELKILPKFRELVKNDLTQDYMAENKYLIRFLRARRLDLKQAEEMMRKNLAWRKDQKMDNVLLEDFSWWEKNFPFFLTSDKEGRPAIGSGLGQMDFRKYVLNGKGQMVHRYIFYCIESSLRNIHKVSNETGVEYIGGYLLFNLAGYNARSHACLACLPYWIQLAQWYENYYPQLGYRLIAINSPKLFEVILELMSPFITPATVKALRIYGFSKEEWKLELLKLFPAQNLTPDFGGTRKI